MLEADVAIIGAGVTGLSAAFHLSALDQNKTIVVLESDDTVGGQSRSIPLPYAMAKAHGVFSTWEKGIHTLFTQDSYVYGFYDSIGVVRQPRKAKLVLSGVTIDYPYQANKGQLPTAMQQDVPTRCLGPGNDNCFAAELLRKYGQNHCDNFFMPYNEKKFGTAEVWQLPTTWGQRKHTGQETGKGHCPEMVYPMGKDFQAMPNALLQRCGPNVKVLTQHAVQRIDINQRTVYFTDGSVSQLRGTSAPVQTLRYKALVNTSFDMLEDWSVCVGGMIPWLFRSRYVRTAAVLTPTANIVDQDVQWYVVANSNVDLIRVSNHNAVRSTESPYTLLIAEFNDYGKVTKPPFQHPSMGTLQQLQVAGVIKDTIGMWSNAGLETGILYSQDARTALDGYLAELKQHGIWSIGRFGGAEYIDCDECIVLGRDTAMEILK